MIDCVGQRFSATEARIKFFIPGGDESKAYIIQTPSSKDKSSLANLVFVNRL